MKPCFPFPLGTINESPSSRHNAFHFICTNSITHLPAVLQTSWEIISDQMKLKTFQHLSTKILTCIKGDIFEAYTKLNQFKKWKLLLEQKYWFHNWEWKNTSHGHWALEGHSQARSLVIQYIIYGGNPTTRIPNSSSASSSSQKPWSANISETESGIIDPVPLVSKRPEFFLNIKKI